MFDDHEIDTYFTFYRAGDYCDAFRRTIIESYKLGFAIMLELPIHLRKLPERPKGWEIWDYYERERQRRSWITVAVRPVEFAEYFSTATSMSKGIEQLLLSEPIGRREIRRCCGMYLRIATVIQSETLFQEACVFACNHRVHSGWQHSNANAKNAAINMTVLRTHAQLRDKVDSVVFQIGKAAIDVALPYGSAWDWNTKI